MNPGNDTQKGLWYALAAFAAWGFFPAYLKTLQHVPALELLAHRVVWSVAVCLLLTALGRDWAGLKRALASRKVMGALLLSTTLITVNWLVFIHAILSKQVLAASMGYFINPLVNVLLGVLFLGEKLSTRQKLAVCLAAAGTLNLAISQGNLPWISLSLPILFGFYGLLRKTVAVEAVHGLLIETTLISPVALGYIIYLWAVGAGSFLVLGWGTDLLLLTSGLATTLPLVWFTAGARRLHYSTIGLIQYLAPSIHFILGVFVYGEPFGTAHLVTFACIWAGLAVFALDNWGQARAARNLAQREKGRKNPA